MVLCEWLLSSPPRAQQGLWADQSCAKGLLGPQCRPLARDHWVDRRKWHWKGRAHTSWSRKEVFGFFFHFTQLGTNLWANWVTPLEYYSIAPAEPITKSRTPSSLPVKFLLAQRPWMGILPDKNPSFQRGFKTRSICASFPLKGGCRPKQDSFNWNSFSLLTLIAPQDPEPRSHLQASFSVWPIPLLIPLQVSTLPPEIPWYLHLLSPDFTTTFCCARVKRSLRTRFKSHLHHLTPLTDPSPTSSTVLGT